MFKGVNKIILLGLLGTDIDIHYLKSGSTVVNLKVVTNISYLDKNSNETIDRIEWHKVVLWGKLAKLAEECLKKESKVYIEGYLKTDKWQDSLGNDKYMTKVVATNLLILDFEYSDHNSLNKNNNIIKEDKNKIKKDVFDEDIPF